MLATREPASFAARFADVLPRLRVAVREGVVIGFSLMTDGHIDMMFVDPAAHRSGAGRALLAECEERGAQSLECFRDNTKARAFYEAHGWRIARQYERVFAGRARGFVFYQK
ncbi:MAG: GNAT family N-acetyltransferase [Alphaproteobacteria bacterium]|nr:GNAT family N-acetyltransferase [Alphaproteobacteria bacterium]